MSPVSGIFGWHPSHPRSHDDVCSGHPLHWHPGASRCSKHLPPTMLGAKSGVLDPLVIQGFPESKKEGRFEVRFGFHQKKTPPCPSHGVQTDGSNWPDTSWSTGRFRWVGMRNYQQRLKDLYSLSHRYPSKVLVQVTEPLLVRTHMARSMPFEALRHRFVASSPSCSGARVFALFVAQKAASAGARYSAVGKAASRIMQIPYMNNRIASSNLQRHWSGLALTHSQAMVAGHSIMNRQNSEP